MTTVIAGPGRSRLRLSPRHVGYVATFALQLLSITLSITAFRLAASCFSPQGFGEYALARRAMSCLTFPILLGLGTSLPRFVTQHRAGDPGPGPGLYARATLAIAGPMLLMAWAVIAAWPGPFARFVFGDERFAMLTRPTLVAMTGLYLHMIAYGFLVARFRTGAASLLQVANVAAAPALAIAASGGDVAASLVRLGLGTSATSLVVGGWAAASLGVREAGGPLGRPVRDLLGFGLPRVPGELALFGLFGLPGFVQAWRGGVESAGLLAFGIQLVQLLGAVFAAGAVLLLPMTGRMIAEGRRDRIGPLVTKALIAALALNAVMVGVAEVVLEPFAKFLLGPTLASAGLGDARWTMPSSLPYVAFLILRGPLDSMEVWPHNSINLGSALVLQIGLLLGPWPCPSSIAFLASLGVLGVLSIASWIRCVNHPPSRETCPSAPGALRCA